MKQVKEEVLMGSWEGGDGLDEDEVSPIDLGVR